MSQTLDTTIPIPPVPVQDVVTGELSPVWYRFFLALLARTGGGIGVLGIPGGAPGNVQFNKAGAFGGLTNTQLTALIQIFTGTISGAVPASGGGTTNFLRADGTFDVPGSTLIVDDINGHTIASTGTLTFEGVLVSGASPSAIVNMTTIAGIAGVGIGDGAQVNISGGASGTGATGNGADVIVNGGKPLSTNGDGGGLSFSGADATGNGDGGDVAFTVGSAAIGTPGRISFSGEILFDGGTPTIPAVNSNTISGTDQTGLITIGAGATTAVTVTFGGNYPFAVLAAVLSPANAAAAASGVEAYASGLSATEWVLNGAALANCAFYYHVF